MRLFWAHLCLYFFDNFSAILPQMRTLPLIVTFIRYALSRAANHPLSRVRSSVRGPNCPARGHMPLRPYARALSPKMENGLVDIQMLRIKRLFSLHQCPGNYQHLNCKLYSHLSLYPRFTFSSSKYLCKVGPE